MPQVNLIITRLAQSDLARVYDFLHDLGATKQADAVMRLLGKSFLATRNNPKNSRIYELSVNGEILENIREVLVFYGKGGYSYLFRHDMAAHTVLILTVKHFREERYRLDSADSD